jgi:hypothetical protein
LARSAGKIGVAHCLLGISTRQPSSRRDRARNARSQGLGSTPLPT